MKILRNEEEVVWWESLVVLRAMKVGDIAELSDGTYGKVEKFAQGVFYPWKEVKVENAGWVFVNDKWHHHRDLFFKGGLCSSGHQYEKELPCSYPFPT